MYGQKWQGNLRVRKVYGQDGIRYLRCSECQEEFSERKNTALWNSKIPEEQAISVAEHLAERCSFKGTARLVGVDPETVRRLNKRVGRHGLQNMFGRLKGRPCKQTSGMDLSAANSNRLGKRN
jgi:transposase-like protein